MSRSRLVEAVAMERWLRGLGHEVGDTLPVVWIPVPLVAITDVAGAVGSPAAVAWRDPVGFGCIGFGASAVVTAAGPARFAVVREAVNARLRATPCLAPVSGAPPPRVFGGFAFQPGSAVDTWRGFSDARFILPRLAYVASGEQAWLGLARRPDETLVAYGAACQRMLDLAGKLERTPRREPVPRPAATCQLAEDPGLLRRLEAAQSAIANDELAKVVISHEVTLRLDPPPNVMRVLERLVVDNPTSTAFAFTAEGACFLGATPERLVARHGLSVTAEAIAGSAGRDTDAARGLLLSEKDLAEHGFVVRGIVEALRPFTATLDLPSCPVLRELSNVVHLRTPIVGRLARDLDVLELVRLLHPTPAVGGTPTEAALAWLALHEPTPRGWYAGPVGWVDGTGDGDFVVALRSGLLIGHHAELRAGAGVVKGSEPAAELAEIHLKLMTFLSALGVRSP
ncbi:MAG: isochorismate synthase [Polyangiaceae bacterium]|nr:isochorismate synthase [Polyangiaceae bacterium]